MNLTKTWSQFRPGWQLARITERGPKPPGSLCVCAGQDMLGMRQLRSRALSRKPQQAKRTLVSRHVVLPKHAPGALEFVLLPARLSARLVLQVSTVLHVQRHAATRQSRQLVALPARRSALLARARLPRPREVCDPGVRQRDVEASRVLEPRRPATPRRSDAVSRV